MTPNAGRVILAAPADIVKIGRNSQDLQIGLLNLSDVLTKRHDPPGMVPIVTPRDPEKNLSGFRFTTRFENLIGGSNEKGISTL